ncbi:hypothetical protein RB195_014555 [Necator americanus]|uniref:Uncharacterized protein n=1 Tax=Necator americanus TaxID=51031 RepID=A0ABR1E0R3_NECAM
MGNGYTRSDAVKLEVAIGQEANLYPSLQFEEAKVDLTLSVPLESTVPQQLGPFSQPRQPSGSKGLGDRIDANLARAEEPIFLFTEYLAIYT